MISSANIPRSLFTVAALSASIFSTTTLPKSLYSSANTPFQNSSTPSTYINPLTTDDAAFILFTDNSEYYLTWG